MIHWLVQTLADHPDLQRGVPPPGLLSPAESARLAALRAAKRRRDWLLGRWTAKHLLQTTLDAELGLHLPLAAYSIETDTSGAPRPSFDPSCCAPQDHTPVSPNPDTLSLSISHSGDHAFCALSLSERARVGADIEGIADRSPEFLDQYFTVEEVAAVLEAPADCQGTVATLIWSAKESALKALRLGLRGDTCRINCPIRVPADAGGAVPFGYLWTRFDIHIDPGLLAEGGLPASDEPGQVTGWWQIMSNYVLTMVLIS